MTLCFHLHSLVRRSPSTRNAMSRRCLGMCWTRSSKPSLCADCVCRPHSAPDSANATLSLPATQSKKTLLLARPASSYLFPVLRFPILLSSLCCSSSELPSGLTVVRPFLFYFFFPHFPHHRNPLYSIGFFFFFTLFLSFSLILRCELDFCC